MTEVNSIKLFWCNLHDPITAPIMLNPHDNLSKSTTEEQRKHTNVPKYQHNNVLVYFERFWTCHVVYIKFITFIKLTLHFQSCKLQYTKICFIGLNNAENLSNLLGVYSQHPKTRLVQYSNSTHFEWLKQHCQYLISRPVK
jgi:hypothetical protein